MDMNEKEKLKILLEHWIEHNREHGGEFREWADKAKGFGEAVVEGHMLDGAQYMVKASECLLKASEELKKGQA